MELKHYLPDHTATIQRTGYPAGTLELPICDRCHQEIGWEERIYRLEDGWVCEDCFKEDLEDLGLFEIAVALGVQTSSASDVWR